MSILVVLFLSVGVDVFAAIHSSLSQKEKKTKWIAFNGCGCGWVGVWMWMWCLLVIHTHTGSPIASVRVACNVFYEHLLL